MTNLEFWSRVGFFILVFWLAGIIIKVEFDRLTKKFDPNRKRK